MRIMSRTIMKVTILKKMSLLGKVMLTAPMENQMATKKGDNHQLRSRLRNIKIVMIMLRMKMNLMKMKTLSRLKLT